MSDRKPDVYSPKMQKFMSLKTYFSYCMILGYCCHRGQVFRMRTGPSPVPQHVVQSPLTDHRPGCGPNPILDVEICPILKLPTIVKSTGTRVRK
jgi:hypothetical protein